MGHSHAGLLTHGGELYTWGSGNAARLGHGHGGAASTPQRVHTLWGAAATVVKCSDSASAAVSQVSTVGSYNCMRGNMLHMTGPAGGSGCVLLIQMAVTCRMGACTHGVMEQQGTWGMDIHRGSIFPVL